MDTEQGKVPSGGEGGSLGNYSEGITCNADGNDDFRVGGNKGDTLNALKNNKIAKGGNIEALFTAAKAGDVGQLRYVASRMEIARDVVSDTKHIDRHERRRGRGKNSTIKGEKEVITSESAFEVLTTPSLATPESPEVRAVATSSSSFSQPSSSSSSSSSSTSSLLLLSSSLESVIHTPRNSEGCTALHLAAKEGHFAASQWLAFCGIPVNARDFDGQTALFCAVKGGHKSVAEMLMRTGGDVSIADGTGLTPMDVARERGDDDMLSMLLERSGPTVDMHSESDDIKKDQCRREEGGGNIEGSQSACVATSITSADEFRGDFEYGCLKRVQKVEFDLEGNIISGVIDFEPNPMLALAVANAKDN